MAGINTKHSHECFFYIWEQIFDFFLRLRSLTPTSVKSLTRMLIVCPSVYSYKEKPK